MTHQITGAILLLCILTGPAISAAAEFPVQARLFAGSSDASLKPIDDQLIAQGLKKMDKDMFYGVEATYSVARFLGLGLRYTKRAIRVDELNSSVTTDYFAQLNQDSVMGMVRLPIIRSSFVILDFFGGFGGANTTFKIKTASQDGSLAKANSDSWFGSTVSAFGASAGVGFKNFFVAVEAGAQTNKVDGLKATGNVTSPISSIDLNGSYVMLSLVFDGVTAKN